MWKQMIPDEIHDNRRLNFYLSPTADSEATHNEVVPIHAYVAVHRSHARTTKALVLEHHTCATSAECF